MRHRKRQNLLVPELRVQRVLVQALHQVEVETRLLSVRFVVQLVENLLSELLFQLKY